MFIRILNLISTSLSACVGWFDDIFLSTDMTAFYLVMILLVLVARYLLKPILGSNSSGSRKAGDD